MTCIYNSYKRVFKSKNKSKIENIEKYFSLLYQEKDKKAKKKQKKDQKDKGRRK
jgi:hypothetical protein